ALNDARFLLLDVGAAVSVSMRDMINFALMGTSMAKHLFNIETPRIGLLNIGSEKGKGSKRLQHVEAMLSRLPINFIGNVEGHQLWFDTADVVVTEGVCGNILLKSAEGLAKMFIQLIQNNTENGKPPYFILNRFDANRYGGAFLLGVNGVCIVCHGEAEETAYYHAIAFAKQGYEINLTQRISDIIQSLMNDHPEMFRKDE
ncbi:phosphate--acyl-ACP acyltransferase, partial [bacterium]|nr:phosphate--acyl-ACP acyltransferase [candidate division CSSED10-310 bacterium]